MPTPTTPRTPAIPDRPRRGLLEDPVIHPIRYYGDPILRRAAAPVREFDADLAALASDMIETMHDANGVGLAAPQIGVGARIFVALELAEPDPAAEEPGIAADAEAVERDGGAGQAVDAEGEDGPEVLAEHVMVNPVITARDGVRIAPDGCLSLPGLWVESIERAHRVTVRYQGTDGTEHEREARGHFAHVIQHELDHLDGLLYFDRLPDAERRRFLEEHRKELADLQREAKAFLKELRTGAAGAS